MSARRIFPPWQDFRRKMSHLKVDRSVLVNVDPLFPSLRDVELQPSCRFRFCTACDISTVIKDETRMDLSPNMLPTRIRQLKRKIKFERISRGSLDSFLNCQDFVGDAELERCAVPMRRSLQNEGKCHLSDSEPAS